MSLSELKLTRSRVNNKTYNLRKWAMQQPEVVEVFKKLKREEEKYRYHNNPKYKEQIKKAVKKWNLKNPEKIKQYHKKYYTNHKNKEMIQDVFKKKEERRKIKIRTTRKK